MCISTPWKVVQLCANHFAIVEFNGTEKEVSTAMTPGVEAGDYVVIRNEYAIARLEPNEAEMLQLVAELAVSGAPFLLGDGLSRRVAHHSLTFL